MALTIRLNRDLAERLRLQARARHLSAKQWALAILANASERPDQPETWTDLNDRRVSLIQKRYGGGLNGAEEKELEMLQAAAAKSLEPADRRRLAHVQALAQEVTESRDE